MSLYTVKIPAKPIIQYKHFPAVKLQSYLMNRKKNVQGLNIVGHILIRQNILIFQPVELF